MRLVVAVTGASGIPITTLLLRELKGRGVDVSLVVTREGRRLIAEEGDFDEIRSLVTSVHDERDFNADIASGSAPADGMVVVPCSMKTLASIAHGLEDNLITRSAGVCLKQERRLILVPRETPLNRAHIMNMLSAKENGATILPPMLTFYIKPESIDDMVAFVVGRILELLGIEHELYRRWKGREPS